jgi:two-component SAPR family response regulator
MAHRAAKDVCKTCGQRLLTRYGVRFSPKCAEIFDMIERAKDRGVAPQVLRDIFFPDANHQDSYNGLKTHIWQINNFLAETDLCVRMRDRPHGSYRVERR